MTGLPSFPALIWPNETWNVRAVFNRVATPALDAAHRWTTSIHIPEPGQRISLNQTGRVEGCDIRLQWIENSTSIQGLGDAPVRILAAIRSPRWHVWRSGQKPPDPYAWE